MARDAPESLTLDTRTHSLDGDGPKNRGPSLKNRQRKQTEDERTGRSREIGTLNGAGDAARVRLVADLFCHPLGVEDGRQRGHKLGRRFGARQHSRESQVGQGRTLFGLGSSLVTFVSLTI